MSHIQDFHAILTQKGKKLKKIVEEEKKIRKKKSILHFILINNLLTQMLNLLNRKTQKKEKKIFFLVCVIRPIFYNSFATTMRINITFLWGEFSCILRISTQLQFKTPWGELSYFVFLQYVNLSKKTEINTKNQELKHLKKTYKKLKKFVKENKNGKIQMLTKTQIYFKISKNPLKRRFWHQKK